MNKYAIGVDVGGSHISCAVVDLENGCIVKDSRFKGDVNNKADKDSILKSWATVLNKAVNIAGENLIGIGFGMPGPFEYDKGIARFAQVEKFYSLNGIDVGNELAKLIDAKIPFRFMNDASAFAAGEAWMGSARYTIKSISITLGTGFGSAFVNDGVPVVEGEGIPPLGCLWHLPYSTGIADDFFSTRWFISQYKELTGIEVSGVKQVGEAAQTNIKAKAFFDEYGYNMGEFIGPWLKQFDAGVLVIGGNITGAYNLFGPAFETALVKKNINTKIRLSTLKEDAAIIGSARMLDSGYWGKIEPILHLM